jgi:hypothetical protein
MPISVPLASAFFAACTPYRPCEEDDDLLVVFLTRDLHCPNYQE